MTTFMISTTGVSPGGLGHYHGKEEALENPGHWFGKGAKSIQLEGKVKTQDLETVAHGKSPSGMLLKKKRSKLVNGKFKDAHTAGTDAVFSPPKSASILGLVGGDKRIEEAHQFATEETMKVIEADCTIARVRANGQHHKENTKNLIAAAFDHKESRPNDDGLPMPQIHRHFIIFGATRCSDGVWRRLDNEQFFKHQKTRLRKIYINDLGEQLKEMGYGITYTKEGLHFEIEGITRNQELAFSARYHQIDKALGGIEKARSFKELRIAVLQTRNKKVHLPALELKQRWRQIADGAGIDFDKVPGFARTPTKIPAGKRLEFELKAALLVGRAKQDIQLIKQESIGRINGPLQHLKSRGKPLTMKLAYHLDKIIDGAVDRNRARDIKRLLRDTFDLAPSQQSLSPKTEQSLTDQPKWSEANPKRHAEQFSSAIDPGHAKHSATAFGLELTRPKHINKEHWHELVVGSGIRPDIASASFESVDGDDAIELLLGEKLESLGAHAQQYATKRVTYLLDKHEDLDQGGLWCPGVDGWGQLKPNNQRIRDGKPVKYESPPDMPLSIMLPDGNNIDWNNIKDDVAVPVGITEGKKKAASASSHGLMTIGLAGINGALCNKDLRPELKDFDWRGRKVYLVLDKDPSHKHRTLQDSARELYKLAVVLDFYGADVAIGTIPGKLQDKVGIDDHLVKGKGLCDVKWESLDDFVNNSKYLARKYKRGYDKVREAGFGIPGSYPGRDRELLSQSAIDYIKGEQFQGDGIDKTPDRPDEVGGRSKPSSKPKPTPKRSKAVTVKSEEVGDGQSGDNTTSTTANDEDCPQPPKSTKAQVKSKLPDIELSRAGNRKAATKTQSKLTAGKSQKPKAKKVNRREQKDRDEGMER